MARYDAFIVRIWRSVGADGPQWSARLEHLQQTGMTRFGTLEALLAHLSAVAGPLTPPTTPPDAALAGPVSNPPTAHSGHGEHRPRERQGGE